VTTYIVPGTVVFLVSLIATRVVRSAATRRGWIEEPRADRWSRTPRAKLGGVAIFIALMTGLALFAPKEPAIVGLALVSAFIFGVGLLDDFIRLNPQGKLVAQIAAALVLYLLGFHFGSSLPFALDLLLVVVWVVGITNAVNLLDNMDGLAAGVAVIAGGFRFALFLAEGNPDGALLSLLFVAAAAGFLFFNFSPASIFMGDCGSFLLGFFLAALNLQTDRVHAANLVSILLYPALVLALPIFDTALVSTVRWFNGRRISQGGADHSSHRLVAVGLSQRAAVLILWAMAFAGGLAAYLFSRVGFSFAILIAAVGVLGLLLFGIFLSSVSVYPEADVHRRPDIGGRPAFALLAEFRYKRAMLWIGVDLLVLLCAYYAAYVLRFGGTFEWARQFALFVRSAPVVLAAALMALSARGLYRSEWRHFSLHEVRTIVTGLTIGFVAAVLLVTYAFRFEGYSRSVFVLAWGAAILGLGGARLFVRSLAEALRQGPRPSQRVLIYGAGAAGELAVAEMGMNPGLDQVPVGFLDDDVFKHRSSIRGIPVVGGLEALPFVVRKLAVDAVVVSTDKIPPERERRLAKMCEDLRIASFRVSVSMVPLGHRLSG